MWSWPRPRQKMRSWPQVSMTARFSMRSWPGGGGRLESERVPLPGSGGSRSTRQPFQPLPLPTTSKHSRTSLFLLWNLLLFQKCLYPGNSYPALHYQHYPRSSTEYSLSFRSYLFLSLFSLSILYSNTSWLANSTYLYFSFVFSMTKLKEPSREICYSNTCYLHYPACHRLPSHQRCLTSPRWPHVHHIFLPQSTPLFKTKKSPSEMRIWGHAIFWYNRHNLW